jgi:hypothetical protein
MSKNEAEKKENVVAIPDLGEEDPNYDLTPEEMLSEVMSGTKVSIKRIRPPWADCGWLETFEQSDNQPISLEEIEHKYGGGHFTVRILKKGKYQRSFAFQIAGEPRNKNGRLAKNPDIETDVGRAANPADNMIAMAQVMAQVMSSAQPKRDDNQLTTLLHVLQNANNQTLSLMQQMITSKNDQANFDLPALAESVGKVKEISEMLGGNDTDDKNDDFDQLGNLAVLGDLFGKLLGGDLGGALGGEKKESPIPAGLTPERLAELVNNMPEDQKEIAAALLMRQNDQEELDNDEPGEEFEDDIDGNDIE